MISCPHLDRDEIIYINYGLHSGETDSTSSIALFMSKQGSEGKTKTVVAVTEGLTAAEYLTEVTVIRGSCCGPEPNGTSL